MNAITKEVTVAKAIKLMVAAIETNDPVYLWGLPGIGKSEAVYQVGKATNRNVIEYRANLREPVDVRGIPVPDHDTMTTRWFVPDELPRVERDGEFGILFLDELNTASDQMMTTLLGLVLDRKVGEYKLPDGWIIVAAGNRVGDRTAARRLPTALRNRFAHVNVAPDVDAWCKWANANNIAPEVVAFVRLRPTLIHMMPKGDENSFPTPRSLVRAAKYVTADKSVRMDMFAAWVGDAVAAELDGFIELYRSLGSLDDIIKNPTTAPVPTEPSMRFAVSTGLARMAKRDNFANVMTYAKRLPRESQMLLVTDATERDAKLKETQAYGEWAVTNQHLTLQAA
jgi:MoxR-like ATPase